MPTKIKLTLARVITGKGLSNALRIRFAVSLTCKQTDVDTFFVKLIQVIYFSKFVPLKCDIFRQYLIPLLIIQ